jgi:hypothetical protein
VLRSRVSTAVWRATPAVVLALDGRLGPPVDGYVNGTQTWLTDDGPGGATLEWRLHPVAGFRAPAGTRPEEVFDSVVAALASGGDPDTLEIGDDRRALASLWDGLECFPAYGDEMEPVMLAHAATDALGIAPDAGGLVDHGRIGDAWERASGTISLTEMLLDELASAT